MKNMTTKFILVFILVIPLSGIVSMFTVTYMMNHNILFTDDNDTISVAQSIAKTMQESKPLDINKIEQEYKERTGFYIQISLAEQFSPIYHEKVVELKTIDRGNSTISPPQSYSFLVNGETYVVSFIASFNMKDSIVLVSWAVGITSLLIGVLLSLFLYIFFIRPIRKLTRATKQLADGDFNITYTVRQSDEIGQLWKSFLHMKDALKTMMQAKQDFISNVSHEYQTPLTSIRGFAKVLQKREFSREEQLKYIHIIDKESERLSLLSKNVLKLSHLQSYALERESFRMDELVRDVIINLEPLWSEKQLNLALDSQKLYFNGDQMLMIQVWVNLINNAIAFSPPKGMISIVLKQHQEQLILTIKDEGPGISDQHMDRIWEPFYKEHTNTKGNGLGLSIVHQIILLHEGTITLNNNVAPGLTIEMKLPIKTELMIKT